MTCSTGVCNCKDVFPDLADVDLVKFEEQLKKPVNELTFEEKIYYFLHFTPYMSDEALEALIKDNPILHKMFQTLAQYHWTQQELLQYEQHLNESSQVAWQRC